MVRHLDRVDSRSLGRPVHLWRYGHHGAPLLVFPSAAGVAHEWGVAGVPEMLASWIDAGRLKLYCTESNVAETWAAEEGDPAERVRRHQAFERYVLDELVPLIAEDCRTPGIRIALAGASLGALYSATLALKHPDVFYYALCLSGRYDVSWLTDGFFNDDLHYDNPMAFAPGLAGATLERIRRHTRLVLVCGQGAHEGRNVEATRDFAAVLESRGIPHTLDLWGHDVTHEWPWWRRQIAWHLANTWPDELARPLSVAPAAVF